MTFVLSLNMISKQNSAVVFWAHHHQQGLDQFYRGSQNKKAVKD
jgi:hypothetical protein